MNNNKEILDAVHGYIVVPCDFVEKFINTPIFQRLQNVSQSAIRSLFPSANHNRYMHSLGVFHIGQLIVKTLGKTQRGIDKTRVKMVQTSYLIACLLHDVGHAPFSHSLEDYFLDGDNLIDALSLKFGPEFKEHMVNPKDPKPHEYASAIVICNNFPKEVHYFEADMELICRMIIGYPYPDEEEKSYENCYISLLHGDLVDADRLDYACRDVWASGYSTSTVDVQRLLEGLAIKKNDNKYVVCFADSVINEIESLMTIKEFQSHNIFSHRIIAYEQYLLIHALEFSAAKLFNVPKEQGTAKLKDIIHVDTITPDGKTLTDPQSTHFSLLSDIEVYGLMRRYAENQYFKELYERKYTRISLWKTIDEFYYYFPRLKDVHTMGSKESFTAIIKGLLNNLGITDVAIGEVKYAKKYSLEKLNIILNEQTIVPYSNLRRPKIVDNLMEQFYYCYIKLEDYKRLKKRSESKTKFRIRIMKAIDEGFQTRILSLNIN